MSMDWNACFEHIKKIANPIQDRINEFIDSSPSESCTIFWDGIIQEYPPLLIVDFFVHGKDGRRSEVYGTPGVYTTILRDIEKECIGSFMGKIIEQHDLTCKKSYTPKNARIRYYLKPKYDRWDTERKEINHVNQKAEVR